MKRILYVASVDFNTFGGASQAVRAYLDSLIDIYGNKRIDVLIGDEFELLEEYKGLNCIKVPKRSKLKAFYEILFKGSMVRWTIPLRQYLKENYNKYESVIINSTRSGVIVPFIKKLGLKVVTIHHNDEVEYCMDNKNIYTLGGRTKYFVERSQRIAYTHSDINLFLTNHDFQSFVNKYGRNNKFNNVLGVYDYKSLTVKLTRENQTQYNIGISGSLKDYQTVHGINNLKDNYFDIIQDLIPNLKMLITGRSPSEQIIQFAANYQNTIDIVPSPKDLLLILQYCTIYLCPTDIGGGIKLRIMDGLKLGLPILTHKVSARGYDIFYDKPYFKVYTDRKTFRQGLKDILVFINNSDDYRAAIRSDYYLYFGYRAGTCRLKEYLNENLSNNTKLPA